jgi:Uma2 family endonuclease
MASAPIRDHPRMSVDVFRGFLEGRPDEERWELIDGVAVMMTPPTKVHQRIASNLERLLNDALERHDATLTAYQAVGVNLGPRLEHYDPEPDVVVVDAADEGERYSDRFYLAAEVVSSSDRTYVESKREVYKQYEACRCILTIQHERMEVRVDRRADDGWSEHLLRKSDDPLAFTDFGLSCKVSDLYRGTKVQRR